jgi:hypothetical protein
MSELVGIADHVTVDTVASQGRASPRGLGCIRCLPPNPCARGRPKGLCLADWTTAGAQPSRASGGLPLRAVSFRLDSMSRGPSVTALLRLEQARPLAEMPLARVEEGTTDSAPDTRAIAILGPLKSGELDGAASSFHDMTGNWPTKASADQFHC